MSLLILALSIVLLLVLIAWLKFNAFLALLLTSFAVGLLNGLAPDAVLKSILTGIGDTMGSLALILAFGAMLGKLIEESGAAHSITHWLTGLFGLRRIQLSVVITGLVVGLPMIYNASFLTLIPLIYTFAAVTKLPLMYLGIPLSSALSVTHGYLPPHPAPTAISQTFHADPNITLLFGLTLVAPATFLAGPLLSRFFRHLDNRPPAELFADKQFRREDLPGIGRSLFTMLIPVLLMLAGAVLVMCVPDAGRGTRLAKFFSDPNVALGLAVLLGLWTLGLRHGRTMDDLMKSMGAAVASIAMVLFIIAGGGAFKQVLLDSGTGTAIEQLARSLNWSPLLLGWSAAALVRLALGSATVSAITAAGIVGPLLANSDVRPELMVLAVCSGSLMFSHFNDIGFWMFKEYYNVSIKHTFLIWTVMESIVAIVGLVGVLVFNAVLPARSPAGGGWATEDAKLPRVFYLNSYHAGYASSDQTMLGINETLAGKAHLKTFFLDSKRQSSPELLGANAAAALQAIRNFQPQVLIASDDDAVKYVVVPHFKDGPMPVVFCGVNWTCESYGLPTAHVTGMLEVLPIRETIETLQRHYPAAKRLTVLSENSVSEQKNKEYLLPIFASLGLTTDYVLVDIYTQWKEQFLRANQSSDLIFLPTNGAIRDWDPAGARALVRAQIRVPAFTCDDFMMVYAVFGLTKVAKEQGQWAAQTALDILAGRRPADIAVPRNRQTAAYLNPVLAEKIGFHPEPALLNRCQHIE
jgi:gluconate transporter